MSGEVWGWVGGQKSPGRPSDPNQTHANTCGSWGLVLVPLWRAAMAGYIQSGEVRARRSPWRLSIIPDTFFALINVVLAFFRTMFSLDAHQNYGKRSDSRRPGSSYGGGGGGPGGPGGGGGPSGAYGRGPRGMDNVRGIDHSAPAPCGSCCG